MGLRAASLGTYVPSSSGCVSAILWFGLHLGIWGRAGGGRERGGGGGTCLPLLVARLHYLSVLLQDQKP